MFSPGEFIAKGNHSTFSGIEALKELKFPREQQLAYQEGWKSGCRLHANKPGNLSEKCLDYTGRTFQPEELRRLGQRK